MYPRADIPVFEISLDYSFNEWQPKPPQYNCKLASRLAELMRKRTLIAESGNIVHNPRTIDFEHVDAKPYRWAVEFDEKVKYDLIHEDREALLDFETKSTSASYAVPTLDHYLPMICVIALQAKGEPLTFTYEGFQNGSISMRCFQFG